MEITADDYMRLDKITRFMRFVIEFHPEIIENWVEWDSSALKYYLEEEL